MRFVYLILGWIRPRPPAPPAPTPAPTPDLTSVLAELLASHNRERAARGVAPLALDLDLCRVAQLHSDDQAGRQNMSHTGSDGSSPFDRLRRAGYTYTTAGENVAMGYPTAATVVAGWMNSSGHRANILRASFTHVGFGEATDVRGRMYWTALFATPAGHGDQPARTPTPAALQALVPPPLEGLTREVMAAIDERLAAGNLQAV